MKKKRRNYISKALLAIAIIILCGVFALFLLTEPIIKINGWTTLDKNRLIDISKTVNLLDESGENISNAIYDTNKVYISAAELPSHTKSAFVAVEDKRFYSHNGVDYLRILSAAVNNIKNGGFSEGGSTISQQLVKNTHLNNDKTVSRKIQEIRIAKDLERHYSKEEILEMYLNILYFGNNIYGIATASQTIFGKSASMLTLSESALLAGIINNPSKYSPFNNYENSVKRRDLVLKRMYSQNKVTQEEYEKALNEQLLINRNPSAYNQYINASINEAEEITGKTKRELFSGKYTIKTFYNDSLHSKLSDIIKQNSTQGIDINILVADNSGGQIIANSASATTDISTQQRQPGSTIKPIICYAPAIQSGSVYTVTPILDEKISFGNYSPSNYKNKYYGWTTIEDSLVYSLNIPAVKLLEINGIEQSKNFAEKLGLKFDKNDNSLALALGGMYKGVTLTELTKAYQVFARGGSYSAKKYVKAIYDSKGKTVYIAPEGEKPVIDTDTAFLITDMLKKCAQKGTAKKIKTFKNAAAKTGTVGTKDGNSDAYCIAYTPKYTVAVWVGKSSGLMENNISGGTLPSKIAASVLEYLNDKSDFEIPVTVERRDIDLTELTLNHKVLLASESISADKKIAALFSVKNMPIKYSVPSTYIEEKNILDNFDNFKIIEDIGD